MSATEIIQQIKSLPERELDLVFASLLENSAWREDLADLLTIDARRNEASEPINDVFKELGIDA